MIEPEDRYWGGAPGRTWNREVIDQLRKVITCPTVRALQHARRPARSDDRIPPDEVAESNRLMERLGLRTRYRADGRAYLIDTPEIANEQRTKNGC